MVGLRAIISLYVFLFHCYSLLSLFYIFRICLRIRFWFMHWCLQWLVLTDNLTAPRITWEIASVRAYGSYLDFPNWHGKIHVLWMASVPNWDPALFEWRQTIEHIHVFAALEMMCTAPSSHRDAPWTVSQVNPSPSKVLYSEHFITAPGKEAKIALLQFFAFARYSCWL